MNSNVTLLSIIVVFFTCSFVNAQNFGPPMAGGEYIYSNDRTECLTEAQRFQVKNQIKDAIQLLKSENRLAFKETNRGGGHPLFAWPLRKAAGIEYNDVYSARFYVDQNMAYPNQISDFDCGTKTYDTDAGYNHAGTDLVTWPFPWKMLDNSGVEIIAAAPGQILYKMSTQFDRSCTNNDNFWNTVYIQHSDGSVAAYGHMKKNSLTTKAVGDMVEEGEFLGIVGSSGNSAIPHLHFEVLSEIEWNGVGTDVSIDPFTGPCNNLNSDTWWQDQKPHKDPRINAVLTHSNYPELTPCDTEITYESNDFDASDMIYLTIFLRDQLPGTSVNFKIIRPDNTLVGNWDYPLTDYYDVSWWMWYYDNLWDMNGQWKWQATYQGETVTHTFNVTGALGVDENNFNATSIYPNPFKDIISISSNSIVQKATITDVLGKTFLVINNTADGIKEINLEALSNGMYFLTLEGDSNQKKTIKLIKE